MHRPFRAALLGVRNDDRGTSGKFALFRSQPRAGLRGEIIQFVFYNERDFRVNVTASRAGVHQLHPVFRCTDIASGMLRSTHRALRETLMGMEIINELSCCITVSLFDHIMLAQDPVVFERDYPSRDVRLMGWLATAAGNPCNEIVGNVVVVFQALARLMFRSSKQTKEYCLGHAHQPGTAINRSQTEASKSVFFPVVDRLSADSITVGQVNQGMIALLTTRFNCNHQYN